MALSFYAAESEAVLQLASVTIQLNDGSGFLIV